MENTRTSNVLKNTRYGIGNKLITLFFAFTIRTIFIKQLGAEYLGVEGLFSNILSLLSLAELGVGNVLTFSLYRPIADRDSGKINIMLKFYKRLYFLIALFVAIAGLLCIPFLKYIVNTSFSMGDVVRFYIFYLANSVVSYVAVCYTTLIKAKQEQYIIDVINCISRVLTSIAQIVILVILHNFVLYLIITVISTLLQNIASSVIAKNRYGIDSTTENISSSEKRLIYENVKSTFLYKISVVIINATDNILISFFVGTIFVGYYSNYSLIVNQVNSLVAILCTALIASVGNLSIQNNSIQALIVFNRLLFIFHFFSGLCFIGFTLVFNDVITFWLGPQNTLSYAVCFAIAFSFYLQNMINPVWMYREAYGLFNEIKYLMLVTSIINLVLSIVAGKYFGVAGIVIATGVSRLLTTIWYEPRVLYKKIFDRPVSLYFYKILKYIICTIISFIICFITLKLIPDSLGLGNILAKVFVITVEFSCIFILCNHKSEEFIYWKDFLLARIVKKRKK